MIKTPLLTIGQQGIFAASVVFSVEGGRNSWERSLPGMITVSGAKLMDGEWHYYNTEYPEILYPESSIE